MEDGGYVKGISRIAHIDQKLHQILSKKDPKARPCPVYKHFYFA